MPGPLRLRSWAPVFCYAALIFGLSSFPGKYVPSLFPNSDKLFHFLEYAPFGFLLARAMHRTTALKEAALFQAALLAAVLYGLSDETHQLFVVNRYFSLIDLFFDAIGAGSGIAFHCYGKNRSI
jgi:VanZ family protein